MNRKHLDSRTARAQWREQWGTDSNGVTLTSGFGSPYLVDTAGNFGSVTISASPVPEPASWALCLPGLAAIGLLMNRRRATH